jgi:hypothetical protein
VVCLTAGVLPKEEGEGYEEAGDETAGTLSSHAVYRPVAHKVRHGLAEGVVRLLRRLQRD